MKTRNVLFVVMMLSMLGLVAHAETIVTTADGNGADTFVGNDDNKPSTYNYGDNDDMDIRYLTDTRSHLGFARWDITDIGGMDPTGVQLKLWITDSESSRDWDVYALNDSALDDNWDEMTITYNTAPGVLPTDPVQNGNHIIDEMKTTYLGNILAPAGSGYAFTTSITPVDPNANPLEEVIKADTNNKITLIFIAPADGEGKQYYVRTKEGAAGDGDPNTFAPSLVLPADVNPFWASNPNPSMHEVASGSLTQLCWTYPEPNEVGGTITCDVYFGTTEPNALESDYGLEYTLATGTTDTCVSLPVAPTPLMQYYWVVDVHDSTQPGITHRGRAWSYNTFNLPPTVDAGEDQYAWLTKAVVSTEPVADTCMRDATPRGADPLMDVHGSAGRAGYVRFDLSSLTGMGPGTVENAKLTFMKTTGGARNDTIVTGRVGLKGLDAVVDNTPQGWVEMTLSTDNVGLEHPGSGYYDVSKVTELDMDPPVGTPADVTETITDGDAAGGTIEIEGADLNAFLQGRVDDNGLVTFIMSFPGTSSRGYALATKENTVHAAPLLELTFVPDSAANDGAAEVVLDGTVTDDGQPYGTLGYLWEQTDGPETVSIDPDDTEDTTVLIGTSGWYEFQLTGNDGQEAISDTVQVYVGIDSCDAAQNTPDYTPSQSDLNSDCVVDLNDFSVIASEWLECTSLECMPL